MPSEIKITFLGTSDAVPSKDRNHTSILLSYNEENILVDCGEGTQRQFRKADLNPCKLTRILISHWDGDHVLGLPGLIATLGFSGYNKKLFIYGPEGTKNFVELILKVFGLKDRLDLEINEVKNGKVFETDEFYVECERMEHDMPSNAYSFVEKDKLRIDKKKLEKAKLSGPLIANLIKKKDFVFNGKKYSWKNMTYEVKGRKVSFVLDTRMNKKIVSFVKNSDLFICESSFSKDDEEKARDHYHMTAEQAGKVAKQAKVKKLFLTHISQRYSDNFKKILSEARKEFKGTEMAKDLMSVSL